MYYNMEMMNKAGVDPDDIKTWEDYREAGKRSSKLSESR